MFVCQNFSPIIDIEHLIVFLQSSFFHSRYTVSYCFLPLLLPPLLLFSYSFCPLLVRRYSIASPSLVHRYSIVSMENRWIIDGLLMDYLMREKGNFKGKKDFLKNVNSLICFCLMSFGE